MGRQLVAAWIAAFSTVAFMQTASAAPPAPYSWTGAYAGINVGFSWGSGDSTYHEPRFSTYPGVTGGLADTFSTSHDRNGMIIGPQIGYNYQFNSMWVVGLEADFQAVGLKNNSSDKFSDTYVYQGNTYTITGDLNSSIDWFGTVRARAGVLINPTTLVYATGGLAYGSVRSFGTVTDTFGYLWTFSRSTVKSGWAAGGGIEGAFAPAREWIWRLEYLRVDLGSSGVGQGNDSSDFVSKFYWSADHVADNIVRIAISRRMP
jgi:outer membrane immunogenic protein